MISLIYSLDFTKYHFQDKTKKFFIYLNILLSVVVFNALAGNLQTLFFHQPENPDVKEKICAVLAGYVWNKENPFVKKHYSVIRNMAHLIRMVKEIE